MVRSMSMCFQEPSGAVAPPHDHCWHSSPGNLSRGGQEVRGVILKYGTTRVADDWEACRDHRRFVAGAFVWERGVLALRAEVRRPAAYSRKTAAA
jgi:hypothetical protein